MLSHCTVSLVRLLKTLLRDDSMTCEADGNCLFLNFGSNIEGEIARRKTVLEHRRAMYRASSSPFDIERNALHSV